MCDCALAGCRKSPREATKIHAAAEVAQMATAGD
jgi:hypothetical protein